jgi:hypothetical protein
VVLAQCLDARGELPVGELERILALSPAEARRQVLSSV